MLRQLVILSLFTVLLHSNPLANAYTWLDQEYKDFRTYPRVTKAEKLLQGGKIKEAKVLLKKSLEIDAKHKASINLLLKLCIKEKDEACIQKYSQQGKNVGLGYFYKQKAEKAQKKHAYAKAIKMSQKALQHTLKKSDRYFIKLILFESYLKLQQYHKADQLIHKDKATLYQLFKWSKISENLNETNYAFSLAKELPNKLEYLKWRVALLIKDKRYKEAIKDVETLNKMEATPKNQEQLLYLYSLSGQKKSLLKNYEKTLKKGCDKYALRFILNYYKKNQHQRNNLLKKYYPYPCLSKKEQIELSFQFIKYLNKSAPKKANAISKKLAKKLTKQKELINLYQLTHQKNKLVKLYQKKINQQCDSYALYFLLDHYKHNKKRQQKILKKAYPFNCLTQNKKRELTLQLISMLGEDEVKERNLILNQLTPQTIKIDDALYFSNLESSQGNNLKAINYAKQYLSKYPHNSEALKNIGFLYFKEDKKEEAYQYLIEASKHSPKDYALLKNIGYLCIDLKSYQSATYYWNLYLTKSKDKEIQLKLALLYYEKLNDISNAKKLLTQYEHHLKNYTVEYYALKAKLLYNNHNKNNRCQESLKYYKKALTLEAKKQLRYEQIHLLQQCKQPQKALKLMQKFSKDYPTNLLYKKELAYMYLHSKNSIQAIQSFNELKNKEPKKVEYYMALGYSHKNLGQKKESIDAFTNALMLSKNMHIEDRQNIKREITTASKIFHFYLAQSFRLNSYKQGENVSALNAASYNGFGSLQFSYQPTFLPKTMTLYTNLIHGHKKIKDTLQPSIGIRYKPFKKKKIYLSAEKLIKGGKSSQNDTLLRASLGITGEADSNIHQELYLEGAYFTQKDSSILYGNYEIGKIYKINNSTKIIPYLTTGGTYNNDNREKKSVTKLDIGVGLTLDIDSGESTYTMDKYRHKLKLEVRKKYAGTSQDKETLRLQWEFFY